MSSARRNVDDPRDQHIEPMTADEFIAWDDGTDTRYQLIDGIVRAMSPASTTHGTIQADLARRISNHLDVASVKCRVLTEPAVQTRIHARKNMRVPDLGVTCTPDAAGQIALPDPILLIEIISPGNKKDTWDNVWAYASIPTVHEILIVESTRIEAHLLRRQADGSWPPDPETIPTEGTLALSSIDYAAPLRDIYAKTYLLP